MICSTIVSSASETGSSGSVVSSNVRSGQRLRSCWQARDSTCGSETGSIRTLIVPRSTRARTTRSSTRRLSRSDSCAMSAMRPALRSGSSPGLLSSVLAPEIVVAGVPSSCERMFVKASRNSAASVRSVMSRLMPAHEVMVPASSCTGNPRDRTVRRRPSVAMKASSLSTRRRSRSPPASRHGPGPRHPGRGSPASRRRGPRPASGPPCAGRTR